MRAFNIRAYEIQLRLKGSRYASHVDPIIKRNKDNKHFLRSKYGNINEKLLLQTLKDENECYFYYMDSYLYPTSHWKKNEF